MLKYHLFIFLMSSVLTACSHVSYYTQAIGGQLEVFGRSQPIKSVLDDTEAPLLLKQQLMDVLEMRAFAIQELLLPDNASYTHYADLKRPYIMWSVFATPQFSLKPKEWCFLFVGCISYLPHFNEKLASQLAKRLKARDFDVYIGGITAYSSLGWFNDPIFNTMLNSTKPKLAGTIFHELAHRLLYIPGDTVFNESFASVVAEIGTARWLAKYGTSEMIAQYQQSKQRDESFIALMLETREHLQQLYQENLPPMHVKAAKSYAFKRLQARYNILKKTEWMNYSGYDDWIADINNAKLASIATYHDYVPAFKALFFQQNGDLRAFYQAAIHLGKLPEEQRYARLQQLQEVGFAYQKQVIPTQSLPVASQKYHSKLLKY